MPETARRAIQNFFTAGNLTALRELALRRTADRVDDQMVDYLRQKAIEGPWAASERLLACVGAERGLGAGGAAREPARDRLNAAWTAVTSAGRSAEDAEESGRSRQTLQSRRAAWRRVAALQGADFAEEILRLARRENVTQIVLGQSRAGCWARLAADRCQTPSCARGGYRSAYRSATRSGQRRRLALPKRDLSGAAPALAAALASVACAVLVGAALMRAQAAQSFDDLS